MPLSHIAEPEQVAVLVDFLVSAKASYTTGANYFIVQEIFWFKMICCTVGQPISTPMIS